MALRAYHHPHEGGPRGRMISHQEAVIKGMRMVEKAVHRARHGEGAMSTGAFSSSR